MPYTLKNAVALRRHPGMNPNWRGWIGWVWERNKWIPHQGKRECARRRRQMMGSADLGNEVIGNVMLAR